MTSDDVLRQAILGYYALPEHEGKSIDVSIRRFPVEDRARVIALVAEMRSSALGWLCGPPGSDPEEIPRQQRITYEGRAALETHLAEQKDHRLGNPGDRIGSRSHQRDA